MELLSKLIELLGVENVLKDEPMKNHTSFKAGGEAALFIMTEDEHKLMKTLALLSQEGIPYIILGNGTNILVKDSGYKGAFVKMGSGFSNIQVKGTEVTARAGALLSTLARVAAEHDLAGLEFAAGIPGSVGGGVFMNAGAYDEELKNVIKSAEAVSKDGSVSLHINAGELDMGYRRSRFQKTGEVVTGVTIELRQEDSQKIASKMKELATRRSEKQPLWMPSAGSFFKRPDGDFAGRLIEQAGLKGLTVGDAMISPLHAGFIVNRGKATATDIINLMKLVQNIVYDKTGVRLEPEVRIIGD